MPSTPTSYEADPHDVFLIESVLAASRQAQPAISAVSPPLAPETQTTSSGTAAPKVDATFRAADVAHVDDVRVKKQKPAANSRANRAFLGFVFALVSAAAAAAWQHYGDTARHMITNWTPAVLLTSSPTPEPPAAEPDASVSEAAAAEPALSATPAQPSQNSAPLEATAPAESAPTLESMSRDLASMGQQIEGLKATIEQLRTSQAQMSRDLAKTSEARPLDSALHPKTAAPVIRPAALPVRRPKPVYAPIQAVAPPAPALAALPPPVAAPPPMQTLPPTQATTQPDGDPVLRPPMPLRFAE